MESSIKATSKKEPVILERFYNSENNLHEISIDEAGRGCMFGRVYIASVILPKNPELFSGVDIKDSKKFSSKTKIHEMADYIKEHALVWNIEYIEADVIDRVNILSSVMKGMHTCISESISKTTNITNIDHNMTNFMAVIDGNYFKPYGYFDNTTNEFQYMEHVTVEKGDGKYMAIAAASILAKTARDDYIIEMCNQYPILSEYYGLNTNMGYGTKAHMEGIQKYGITQWHRRTFGCCKTADVKIIE
jgi:ribonuclease HII